MPLRLLSSCTKLMAIPSLPNLPDLPIRCRYPFISKRERERERGEEGRGGGGGREGEGSRGYVSWSMSFVRVMGRS